MKMTTTTQTCIQFIFLTQIENSIAKEPMIQPTQANQRGPSGNQEIMLVCGLSDSHTISCKVCASFVVTFLNCTKTNREMTPVVGWVWMRDVSPLIKVANFKVKRYIKVVCMRICDDKRSPKKQSITNRIGLCA